MKIKLPVIITIIAVFVIAWFMIFPPLSKNVDMISNGDKTGVTVTMPEYFDGVRGYMARPMQSGSYPGVVMIHEWWGLNDNIQQMAVELAREGYIVLAVDLYNGEVAETVDRARELRTSLDQSVATANLRAAAGFLRSNNANKIASLGWCFGGGQSLQLAISGEDLDATVIYYGSLVTDESELASIDWPVLGIFGEEDASISVDSVREFESSLANLNIQNSIHIYSGVGHAFANPSGDNYAPDETMDAWNKTLAFLEANLK